MTKSSKKSKKKELPPLRNMKEEKLFQNLLKITEQFMSGKSFTPLTEADLLQRLSLPTQHEMLFREVLEALIQKKIIEYDQGRYSWRKSHLNVVQGLMRMHPRGFGFVQTQLPSIYTQDIFIPKHLTKNAIDGDVVEVMVNQEVVSEKGPEGRVVAILERARTHMAGIIRTVERNGDLLAYVPLLGAQQRVLVSPTEERDLKVGDRVVMKVEDWGSKETETICQFSHYLGNISDPSCDISAAIEEFELRADFPLEVIEEAEQFGSRVSAKDLKGREDLRHLVTFTIDPDTAKDFDDALNLMKDEQGHYHLGVHIADVSHYVKNESLLDLEAQIRANSTYFPRFCLPMLPSALSNNLCSLRPDVIRLTVSVLMHFDSSGELIDYRIVRSFIKSTKRFTYREAKQILDGKKRSKHLSALNCMVELCHLLKKKRYERGSIEFALPELTILVNEHGVPYQTDFITYDITHQLVEEFMLKANEIVALELNQREKNLPYRVHDEPSEEHLKDFSLLAGAFGFRLPDLPTPRDLQKLFEDTEESSYGTYLASSYIRRMRMALYSAENIGHYGLSLTHYCHFTSPIRRYIDLVIHRILFEGNDQLEYLQYVANHCSEQERISARAENSVVLLKKLRLLQSHHQAEPYKEYAAIITRVKNFGFHFEIFDLFLDGFLHVAELEQDYFIFEESWMRLKGTRTGIIYTVGDPIKVMLKEINLVTLETKWYFSSSSPKTIQPSSSSSPKKVRPSRKKEKTKRLKKFSPKKIKPKKAKSLSKKQKKSSPS